MFSSTYHEFTFPSRRPIDEDHRLASRISQKAGDYFQLYRISCSFNDPFTLVVVEFVDGRIGWGVSKCCPIDRWDSHTGKMVALRRAIEAALER